jgi:hypothetical protein
MELTRWVPNLLNDLMAPLIGFVVFVIGIFISRVIMTRSLDLLDDEEKLRILKAFSTRSLFRTSILLVLLVAFVAVLYFYSELSVFEITVFLLLFALYVSYTSIANYQELVRLSLPQKYLKRYLTSAFAVVGSVIAMAAISIYGLIAK